MSYSKKEVTEATLQYFNGDEAATDVFVNKYALKDKYNNYYELTPADMHRRLAKELARIEARYPNPMLEDEIFSLLDGFKYIVLQGSPSFGIGNIFQPAVSISNCFVIEPPFDSYGGILKTDQEAAHVYKRRGGIGFDISNIRPKGLSTQNAALTTDGIGVFMERYSNTVREVGQQGRRGALMLSISINHIEVETFAKIKNDLTKVTGANISIRLNDAFMEAVVNDTEYEQKFPVDSDTPIYSRMVPARQVWDTIIKSATKFAEPGLLNWDHVLKYSPADIYSKFGFKTSSTNPCLTGDTRVATQFGLKRIDELVVLESELTVSVDNRIDDKNKFGITLKQASKAFKTSDKEEVFLVTTKNGYSFKATSYHKVPTKNGIVELKDLKIGDKLLIQSGEGQWGTIGNEELGTVIGWIEGGGSFCYSEDDVYLDFWGEQKYLADIILPWCHKIAENETSLNGRNSTFGITYDNKHDKCRISSPFFGRAIKKFGYIEKGHVPEIIWSGTKNCVRGYLRGFFGADGYVEYSIEKQCFSIRLSQSNESILKEVQILLSNFGIISSLYKRREEHLKSLPDGKGGNKDYLCKEQFDLCISKQNAVLFEKEIGFVLNTNQKMFDAWKASWSRGPYKEMFLTEIQNIESIGFEPVYCLTQPDNNTFIANGLSTGNCGELPLCPNDSCRLTVLNLFNYVNNPFTKEAIFDFKLFANHAQKAQRIMDDIVDLELEKIDLILEKVISDPEPISVKQIEIDLWNAIKEKCIQGRRTGLGITALGDTLAGLNIRYGDEKSFYYTSEIYKELAVNSYKSSVIMAKERGAFSIFNLEMEENHPFLQRIWDASDPETIELYKQYGRRNIANLTTAPTGSISMLCRTTGGIEPAFLVFYDRNRKLNSEELTYITPDFVDAVGDSWKTYRVYHKPYQQWMEVSGETEYEKSPYYKACSNDIEWQAHVEIQSCGQYWIDHSISKTVNLPAGTNEDTVKEIYLYAWKKGLKGITVYVDGCRSGVLNAAGTSKSVNDFTEHDAIKRPNSLDCDIHFLKLKGTQYTVFVGLLKEKPYEVFLGEASILNLLDEKGNPLPFKKGKIVKKTKGKYDVEIVSEQNVVVSDIVSSVNNDEYSTLSRFISLSLRHGVGIEFVIDQLSKNGTINAFNKVLARILKTYIKDGKAKVSCEKCGSDKVVYQEKCKVCISCGYSPCG